ncbi:MAG: c-type cytochrome [Acidobacteriota bacterium]
MRKRLIAALTGLVLVGLFSTGLALFLERKVAYRSPLYGPPLDWTPRRQSIVDVKEWRRRKAEEKARWAELMKSLTTPKMVMLGKEIVHGRGLCFNCHSVGDAGGATQGPNLAGVGERAATRRPEMSGLDYLAQSLYQPAAFVVPGYAAAMPAVNGDPIALKDIEILMVIAYLQSLGGTPTVQPGTRLAYAEAGAPLAR